ncbi:hypothetical protein Tco_0305077 [Tanacetum coccineum]
MARLEDLEVEIDTLHVDTDDKELLISELQDSLAATENEIAILQIRVADTEGIRAEDHEQIQKILARLDLCKIAKLAIPQLPKLDSTARMASKENQERLKARIA